RSHLPFRSGYLLSSNAAAPATVISSAASEATAPIEFRECMTVPLPSLLRLVEIAQVGRRLVFLRGHQVAVGAEHVVLATNMDVIVAFRADIFAPIRSRIGVALVALEHLPRPRQRVIGYRDLVVEEVRIGFAQIDPLVDDALIVGMQ